MIGQTPTYSEAGVYREYVFAMRREKKNGNEVLAINKRKTDAGLNGNRGRL